MPYANRANNIRGQVVRDIKAGVPPSRTVPNEGWPSNRIWNLIFDLWHSDPRFRPRVSMVARTLGRTNFTIPLPALRRIIEFAAIGYFDSYEDWSRRCGVLRDISLVSRACWLITNPILYRDIHLHHDNLKRFEQIVYALNHNWMKPLSINTSALDSYGNHTRMIKLWCSAESQDHEIIFQLFRALLERSPNLDLVLIYSALPDVGLPAAADSSITMMFGAISTLSMTRYISIFQEFSYLQRLIISEYIPDSPPALEPLLLPHLTGISVEVLCSTSDTSSLLSLLCTWSMPRLQFFTYSKPSLHNVERSPLVEFLRIHGHGLQSLSAPIDDSMLSGILRNCDTLLSARFSGCSTTAISDFPTHQTLERIELHIVDYLDPCAYIGRTRSSPRLENIRQFKVNAWKNLSHLADANFTFVPHLLLHLDDISTVSLSMEEESFTVQYMSGKLEKYQASELR